MVGRVESIALGARECAHQLFAAHAARAPAAVAVEQGNRAVTYGALDAGAERLARRLQRAGVGPEAIVGIALPRSPAMVAAVLAVHKAGGAYLPLDPAHPPARTALMLSDSAAPVVVTDAATAARLPAGAHRTVLVDEPEEPATSEEPLPAPDPERLAYVIYTSGSTGTPKGVMVEHRALCSLLAALGPDLRLTPADRLLALASLSFDMSVVDLHLPLACGARIRLADEPTARDGGALARELDGVTVMQATPSTWRLLIDSGWTGSARLQAISGGETLTPALAEQLLSRCRTLWNFYGPTEATVWCARELLTSARPPIAIGHPLANSSCLILDRDLRRLPAGEVGELYVGGEGLARGYLNRPELSAERFPQTPFGRLYRTGDLARRLRDGRLECRGRTDHQVKVRGHRIELEEIEAALERLPDVAAAAATAREDTGGELRLIACVVPAPGSSPQGNQLRRRLLAELPAYMVPAAITPVQSLPLNASGKLDRAALPDPPPPAAGALGPSPSDALEARVLAAWRRELRLPEIGLEDDLFSLGVSSLAAAKLFARIERELGRPLPAGALFAARTPAALAELLRGGAAPGLAFTSLVPLAPGGSRPPLFVVHGGAGTIMLAEPLARRLSPEQPVYGLQARGLGGHDGLLGDVESIAQHYLGEIRDLQPHGPYLLAGYCFGACVAYEIAQRLLAAGQRVGLLASLDGPAPEYTRVHDPRFPFVYDPDAERPPAPGPLSPLGRLRARAAVRTRLRRRAERYRLAHGLPIPPERRNSIFLEIHHHALRAYRPAPYPGPMLVFSGAGLYADQRLGWDDLAASVEVVEVPATRRPREAMEEPHVALIARRLAQAIEAAAGVPA